MLYVILHLANSLQRYSAPTNPKPGIYRAHFLEFDAENMSSRVYSYTLDFQVLLNDVPNKSLFSYHRLAKQTFNESGH
jgi:hypothetical protein